MTNVIEEIEFSISPIGNWALVSDGGVAIPPPLVQEPVNLVRSSRNPNDASDVRWENGFSYLPLSDGELNLDAVCALDNVSVPFSKDSTTILWTPYILSSKYTCSAMAADVADHQSRAQGLLNAATPKLLEYEFWNGLLAQAAGYDNLYLKQSSGVDVYTASSIIEAIAVCENYLSQMAYGGRGMIHMPAWVSAYLPAGGMRRDGNLLLTVRDTILVPGSGYGNYGTGTGAPPAPTGTFSMYATGITDARLGDIVPWPEGDMYQAIDRQTNTVVTRAQRMGCASWDGVAFARVDTTITL